MITSLNGSLSFSSTRSNMLLRVLHEKSPKEQYFISLLIFLILLLLFCLFFSRIHQLLLGTCATTATDSVLAPTSEDHRRIFLAFGYSMLLLLFYCESLSIYLQKSSMFSTSVLSVVYSLVCHSHTKSAKFR